MKQDDCSRPAETFLVLNLDVSSFRPEQSGGYVDAKLPDDGDRIEPNPIFEDYSPRS